MKGVSAEGYIDAVTSATVNKAKMNTEGGLSEGTYFTESSDGKTAYINGVVFPVIVDADTRSKLIQDTSYIETDFSEASTASYPANYLTASIKDGKITYTAPSIAKTQLTDVKAELSTNTRYGDYQISLSGAEIDTNIASGTNVVYGVIVNTKENNSYPLYTLENIWRNTELAWSSGFVTETHGCPLRPDIYKSIMGETVTDITYITQKGIYDIDIEDTYIPKKTGCKVAADSVTAKDTTEITAKISNMPTSFQPEVTIAGCEAAITQVSSDKNADGTASYTYSIKADKVVPDTYTITTSDKSKEYADILTTVNVKGAEVIFDGSKLTLKDPASGDSIANFVSKISQTDVTKPDGETVTYLPELGRGSAIIAKLFDETGTLDMAAKYESIKKSGGHGNSTSEVIDSGEVFAAEGTYKVAVTTSVYDTVTFDVTVKTDNSNATITKPAKVVINSAKNSAKKTVTVKWNKVEEANGYEVRYVTGKNSKTIKAKAETSSIKISNLKKGKTYKISVRAYKTVNSTTYSGSWSKVLKVKIKK